MKARLAVCVTMIVPVPKRGFKKHSATIQIFSEMKIFTRN
jgi:hypothetical protein